MGHRFFYPPNVHFAPLSYVCARAFPKIKILEAVQANINTFCVEFQELSNAALHVNFYRPGHRDFFPPNEYFPAFSKKNNWKVTLQRIVTPTCINRAKCYILVQEICGCDSNSAFTTLPSAAGTPLFLFLAIKNEKKAQCKISLETYFRIAENAVVLCKNFDTESESVSVSTVD